MFQRLPTVLILILTTRFQKHKWGEIMGVGQTLPKGYSPVPEWEIPSFETEDWKER